MEYFVRNHFYVLMHYSWWINGVINSTRLARDEWYVNLTEKVKMFTLLVVIEEGGDVISKNHSLFLISYIKVSPCPEKYRRKLKFVWKQNKLQRQQFYA
jgi:hypothetical protein